MSGTRAFCVTFFSELEGGPVSSQTIRPTVIAQAFLVPAFELDSPSIIDFVTFSTTDISPSDLSNDSTYNINVSIALVKEDSLFSLETIGKIPSTTVLIISGDF